MQPSTKRPTLLSDSDWSLGSFLRLLFLTVFAFLIMGYHPGLEDDVFYLAAIKRDLNPSLFPHDFQFFTVQFQATIFDKLIALSARLTHLPLMWAILLWQLASIFFILHGIFRIARRCFAEPWAKWSAVTMIVALLTLPVSGTAVNLADQYLHPRNLATAAILAAVVEVFDSQNNDSQNNHSRNPNRRLWLAGILLAIAFAIHAIMAAFGISFCVFLYLGLHTSTPKRLSAATLAALFLFPLGWIFEPSSDAWRKAAATRGFYYLSTWHWYEWLGIFAPLALLFVFHRLLRNRPQLGAAGPALRPLVAGLLYYGVFQTVVGLALMLPPSLERVRPFEPMRYLHLLYLLFFLLAGGLVGAYVLGRHTYRWLLLFLPLSIGMLYAQCQLYPASAHIEWPGAHSNNPWLEAFAWIRQNTPANAFFALDPHYMELPDEDYHGFRALAERSTLADYDKDGGMAARVPSLAPRWLKEVTAETGWRDFQPKDFQRLATEFGVNWIVLSRSDVLSTNRSGQDTHGIICPYQNEDLRVCRLY
jgi:hypothetical protein